MIKQGHIQDSGERENHPFVEVIAEYRRHARRVVDSFLRGKRLPVISRRFRRHDIPVTKQRNVSAVLYYIGTADMLEKM